MPDLRFFVFIRRPAGDYLGGAPAKLVDQAYITLSLPPSDATIMFMAGTPREVADAAAQHAVACGSESARVEEMEKPPAADDPAKAQG